jgi:hypothetical protein
MTKNNKGRNGGDRPSLKTTDARNATLIRGSLKAAIVRLAVWGLIPARFASWLIQCGGLNDA